MWGAARAAAALWVAAGALAAAGAAVDRSDALWDAATWGGPELLPDSDDAFATAGEVVGGRSLQDLSLVSLNNFLFGVQFGGNPGPCVNRGDCTTDVKHVPRYLATAVVSLSNINVGPGSFSSSNNLACFLVNDQIRPGYCDTNPSETQDEGWLASGKFYGWDTQLYNLQFGALTIVGRDVQGDGKKPVEFGTDSLQMSIRSNMDADAVKSGRIPGCYKLLWLVPICNIAPIDFGNMEDGKTFILNKGLINFNVKLKVVPEYCSVIAREGRWTSSYCGNTAKYTSLNEDLPRYVELNSAEYAEPCMFKLDPARLQFPNGVGLSLLIFDLSSILKLIQPLIAALISSIVCAVVKSSLFYAEGPADDYSNPAWKRGAINVAVESLYKQVHQYIQPYTPVANGGHGALVTTAETAQLAALRKANAIKATSSMVFKNNLLYQYLSTTLNDVLGRPCSVISSSCQGLVINELAYKLINDTSGGNNPVLRVPDPRRPVTGVDLGADTFTFAYNEAGALTFRLQLTDYFIRGLNTFSSTFNVLKQSYATNYTLDNSFTLNSLYFEGGFKFTLGTGTWVTSGAKSQDFTFRAGVQLSALNFRSFMTTFWNYEEMYGKLVGTLLDFNTGQAVNALNCSLRTFYGAQLASLQMSGLWSVPTLTGFGSLGPQISALFGLFSSSTQGLLNKQLPAISETLLRSSFNTYAADYLRTLPECWKYVPKTAIRYVNWEDSLPSQAISGLLARAVGGNPVQESDVDINTIVDVFTTKYLGDIETFLGNGSVTIKKTQVGHYMVYPKGMSVTSPLGTLFSLDQMSNVSVYGLEVKNLNSIYRLQFTPASPTEIAVNAGIGSAFPLKDRTGVDVNRGPVSLMFKIAGLVCRGGAVGNNGLCAAGVESLLLPRDELRVELQFNFDVQSKLRVLADQNKLFALDFKDLNYNSCLLREFDDYTFTQLLLNTTKFIVVPFPVQGAFSQSVMGRALQQLQVELNDQKYRITTNQVRYLMQRFATYAAQVLADSRALNKVPPSPGCRDYAYKLNSTALSAVLALPQLTYGAPPGEGLFPDMPVIKYWPFDKPSTDPSRKLVMPATTWETADAVIVPAGHDAFSIVGSPIVESLRSNFQSNGTDKLLRKLANTTFFSEYLTVRADNSVDLAINLTKWLDPFASDKIVAGAKLTFKRFTLNNVGLAAFKFFKVYEPNARFTTSHEVTFNYAMNATLELQIETGPEFVGRPAGSPKSVEQVIIGFEVTNPRLDLVTFLAVDQTVLNMLNIDTFVQVYPNQTFALRDDIQACILKPAFEGGAGLPGLQLTYDQITNVVVRPLNGNLSASDLYTDGAALVLGASLNTAAEMFQQEFKDISQGPLRAALDALIKQAVLDSRDYIKCPDAPAPVLNNPFLDFTASAQMLQLYGLLDQAVFDPESPVNINQILRLVTQEPFSSLNFALTQLPLSYNQKSFGTFTFALDTVTVKGLDSVDKVQLLDWRPLAGLYPGPDHPYTSRSYFSAGADPAPPAKPVDVQLSFNVKLVADDLFVPREGMLVGPTGAKTRVQDDLTVTFAVSVLQLGADLVTKVDIAKFLKIRARAFLQLSDYPCLLEAIPPGGLQIKQFQLALGNVRALLECSGACNSPDLKQLQDATARENPELNALITSAVNASVTLLNRYLVSPDFAKSIGEQIDQSSVNCIRLANPLEAPVTDEQQVAKYMGVVMLCGVFTSFVGAAFLVPAHLRRRDAVLKTALVAVAAKGEEGSAQFALQEQKLASAFSHPAIPGGVRFFVPFCALVNIVFFITAALLTVGANVALKLSLFGDTTQPLDLMSFSLESSIDDMWNAGTIFLSLAIALLSGAWPYVKNLLLIFAWVSPPTVFSTARRESLLEWLDAFGKWALIDVYVLIMLAVGFRFYISSSYSSSLTALLPPDAVIVDVVVNPRWGIYGFLFGAIGTLVLNHVMIHFNRKAMAADEAFEDKIAGTYVEETPTAKVALMQYRFSAADARGRVFGFGPGTKLTVPTLIGMSVLMVLVGAFLPLITFTFSGIAGLAITAVNQDLQSATYSLVSIASSIVRGTEKDFATQIGILFLQIVYVLFALLVPLALMVAYAVLWFVPLTLSAQKRLIFVAEVMNAWEAVLVFAASIVAAVLQISELAQFIVKRSAGAVCVNLETYLLTKNFASTDAKCFDVHASIEPTGWILIFGSLMVFVTSIYVLRLVKGAAHDRYLANKKKDCVCPDTGSGKTPATFSLRAAILKAATTPVARINLNGGGAGQDTSMSSNRSSGNPLWGAKGTSFSVAPTNNDRIDV